MPKPLLKPVETQKPAAINLNAQESAVKVRDPVLLEKTLRKKRSPEYMEIIRKLDLAGAQMDQAAFNDFISAMKKEFPELMDFSIFRGFLGKCFLGPEYDVHSLDFTGSIVCHYKHGEQLPPDFEKARNLAASGSYAFIEIYTDSLRAVRSDGTVSVVKL